MDGVRRLLRLRYPVLLVVAAASGTFDASSGLSPLDLGTFLEGAERLLSSRWADTFADSSIQVGPIFLLCIGVARWFGDILGVETEIVLGGLVHVIVVAAVMATTDRVASDRAIAPVISGVAGAIAITAGLAWTSYISGHPEETVIALAWVFVALWAREDRPLRAGLTLALAGGLKLSGLLGLPLLFLIPEKRARARAVAIALGVSAFAYLPFLLVGELNTFDFVWTIESPLIDVLIEQRHFPWWARVVQGVVAVGAGFLAVHVFRRSVLVLWAAPLLIVAVRILLDPLPQYYFWLGFEALLLIGVLDLSARASWLERVALVAGLYALMVGRYAFGQPGVLLRLIFGIAVLELARRRAPAQIQHQDIGAVRVGNRTASASSSESG